MNYLQNSRTLFVIIMFLSMANARAQIISVVSQSGGSKVYTDFKTAADEAEANSFIYFPGNRNGFDLPKEYKIAKTLHLVGVGYREDLNPMGPSLLNGDLWFVKGADGSTVTGIHLSGRIFIGDTGLGTITHKVDNILVQKCRLNGATQNTPSIFDEDPVGGIGVRFIENIIENNLNLKVSNGEVCNNIFSVSYINPILSMRGGLIQNNIFLNARSVFYDCRNVSICNNIFCYSTYFVFGSYYKLLNNIICTTNTIANNFTNVARDKIFKNFNYDDGIKYTDNYSLQDACVGKNNGTDGKDVGIYGGILPWEDGAIPFNPHIISSEVSPIANPDGTISVKINVSVDGK